MCHLNYSLSSQPLDFPRRTTLNYEGCLTVHLPHDINLKANLMQQGNFIDVFLARHVSGTYAHHQEH